MHTEDTGHLPPVWERCAAVVDGAQRERRARFSDPRRIGAASAAEQPAARAEAGWAELFVCRGRHPALGLAGAVENTPARTRVESEWTVYCRRVAEFAGTGGSRGDDSLLSARHTG